jgi:hypothetical protein
MTPNDSVNSLQGALRQANGSAPKQSSSKPPSSGINDPLDVLSGIIGKRRRDNGSQGPLTVVANPEKPEQFVELISFGDLSLEEFLERKNRKAQAVGTEESIQTAEQCGFNLFNA